jgi:hypothetical protein
MANYIKNLETLKIELHFEKSDYMAMSENDKRKLKSAFLWSKSGKCWVSRAKEPNLYRAIKTAKELGFTEEEKRGERISFAEQMERKAERAEARAERYEEYAENAEKRAENLQSSLKSMRGDIAFFTQPIIAGHAGSRAFARARQRIYDRYERGIEEYKKSEYYQDRAATARATANNEKLSDAIYLDNRIKECKKNLRALQKNLVEYEEKLFDIENGKTYKRYTGDEITAETVNKWIEDTLERYEAEQDKLNFFEDCMDKIGGVQFSRENIKVGYIVELKKNYGKCEVVGAGPANITYKILEGGARGMVLTCAYAAIEKIIAVKEKPEIENPYKEGDILTLNRPADNSVYRAYQVVKATAKGVSMQEIEIENGIPQAGHFKAGSKQMRKGITINKFNNQPCIYCDGWQLYKYVEKSA